MLRPQAPRPTSPEREKLDARKVLRRKFGLSPEQSAVASTVLREGIRAGAPRKHLLASIQTGLVESGLRNLPGGDADSAGFRQERASIYGAGPKGPTNVRASARRFFQEAAQLDRGQRAPELAADVQRPREDLRFKYGDPSFTAPASGIVNTFLRRAKKAGLDVPKPGRGGTGLKDYSGSKQFIPDENTRLKFQKPFGHALTQLAKASGEPIRFQSGLRTRAEQEAAYADYLAGGTLAARPGTSRHEFGAAGDVTLTSKQRQLASRFGLGFPVEGEPWHIELVGPEARRLNLGGTSFGGTSVSAGGGRQASLTPLSKRIGAATTPAQHRALLRPFRSEFGFLAARPAKPRSALRRDEEDEEDLTLDGILTAPGQRFRPRRRIAL